jgi:hypothetical protein
MDAMDWEEKDWYRWNKVGLAYIRRDSTRPSVIR